MERDFMGLNSTVALAAVLKEEVAVNGYEDSGYMKRSAGQFPLPNKVYGLPHLMSFLVSHDDRTTMDVSDTKNTTVFMPIAGTDFHSQKVHSVGGFQMLTGSSQPVAVPIGSSLSARHLPGSHGGISVTAPPSGVLHIGSAPAGIADFRVKTCVSTSQLTILYAGTVNVFNDISPEKAQAITSLAGNYVSSKASKDKVENSSTKVTTKGGVQINQPMNFNQLTAPQARRASLARFLEKRKERVMNVAPYHYQFTIQH